MLKCNGKTFMNLQEAVQWLLNNNALFFMCDEDYAADTEISLSELVNPSPANPKIGSLVLFADGNIATITGITDDSFIVGSAAINIRLQKAVTHFSIDDDSHLIVHYSDGTSDDLGNIFSGNVDIGGQLTATTAKLFENIVDKDGHKRFIEGGITPTPVEGVTYEYARWSLSGTHLMVVLAFTIAAGTAWAAGAGIRGVTSGIPDWLLDKIVPTASASGYIEYKATSTFNAATGAPLSSISFYLAKGAIGLSVLAGGFSASAQDLAGRIQFDLLIDNE